MSDDDLENTVRKLTELMKKKEQDLKREKEELDNREINLETSYPNLGKTDDVLNLNVGGTPMAVLRRTLTQAKGSMLATKFNGHWDDSQTKDSEGRFFIDQKFIYFEKLVDTYARSPVKRNLQNSQSLLLFMTKGSAEASIPWWSIME